MILKSLKKRAFFFLLFVLTLFVFGQKRMTSFHKEMDHVKDEMGLRKLSLKYIDKYRQTHDAENIAYARHIEIYLNKKDTLGNLKRAYQIINYSEETSELRSRAYFWVAVFLENSALDISINYLKKSTALNEKYGYEHQKMFAYHVMGRLYLKKTNYSKALMYFDKTLQIARKNKDALNMASMYNNMSMVYDQQRKYSRAIALAKKSMNLLSKPEDEFFLNVVRTNLGDYYFKMKQFKNAAFYYRLTLQYYSENPSEKRELSSALPNLYEIYKDDPKQREELLENVKKLLDADKTSPFNITLLKIMLTHAFKKGNAKEAENVATKLNDYSLSYKRFLNSRHSETSNLLAKYISEEFAKEQKIQKQNNLIFYLSFGTVFLFVLGGFLYFYRIRGLERNEALLQKEYLEKEKEWIQDRMKFVKLNLELKTKTEQELLNRLKSLRKKPNNDSQEVVKELYLNISNLLQIDKRNDFEVLKESQVGADFMEKIKNVCPNLTTQELKICGYMRLSLTSKELASFIGSTPGAVRVAKSKIKQKLELPNNVKLDDYLKNL